MNAAMLLDHYTRIADAPDAISRLRRFVLDLAVRGRLVEQDAADEPSSELLKRIAAEKARLVKAGEVRARPELSALRHDMPYELPRGWEWVRLAEIVEFCAGRTPARNDLSYWNTGDHAWVSIADMEDGGIIARTKETVSEIARKSIFRSDPKSVGTILMSFKLTIGKIARLGVPAFHNEAIISIHPHIDAMDGYLFMSLSELARAGDTKGAIKGATLNRASLSNILVPLPPLAEQHRIVAKVDELMALCDQLDAARAERKAARNTFTLSTLAKLNTPEPETFSDDVCFALANLAPLTTRPDQIKHLRQTILNLAVHGKLVEQDAREKAEHLPHQEANKLSDGKIELILPQGWQWARLSDVASSRLGKMLDKAKNKGLHYPYLRNTNVHWFEIRLDDIKEIPLVTDEAKGYLLKHGDVLICEGGHGIARTAVWRGDDPRMTFQKALHRVRPGPNLSPDFFAFCCFVYFHQGISQTYFTGVGIPHFTGKALSQLIFPLPPLAEQNRIVAKVDELMALCDQLEANLTTGEQTRALLLESVLHHALEPA